MRARRLSSPRRPHSPIPFVKLSCIKRWCWRVQRACPEPLAWLRIGQVARDQCGFSMVEIVVSIAVLSTTSVALAGAMSTGFLGFRVVEKDVTAGRLATAQMEDTKSRTPYLVPQAQGSCPTVPVGSYPTIPIPAEYGSGYTLAVTASQVLDDLATAENEGRDLCTLERITVSVSYDGSVIRTLEDYKQNR